MQSLNSCFPSALETQSDKAGEGELALLHSELWSSLFRGGCRIGKLQRSLSGYYVSVPCKLISPYIIITIYVVVFILASISNHQSFRIEFSLRESLIIPCWVSSQF